MEKLSPASRKRLLGNRFVQKITDSHIYFTSEFKLMALEANNQGKSPKEFFVESGVDTSLFDEDFANKSVSRWRKIFNQEGEEGFKTERRGRKATGRPKGQQFASQEAELAYLRLENEFLKKLHALAALKEK